MTPLCLVMTWSIPKQMAWSEILNPKQLRYKVISEYGIHHISGVYAVLALSNKGAQKTGHRCTGTMHRCGRGQQVKNKNKFSQASQTGRHSTCIC